MLISMQSWALPNTILIHLIEEFYDNVFPQLGQHTRQRPDAVPLIEWALSAAIALPSQPIRFFRAKPHITVCAGQGSTRSALSSSPRLNIFISAKHILPIMRKCLDGWAGPKDRF